MMRTPSRIFILVLTLLIFLATLAWLGVRHLADILHEFDHVAQVDLVLMETATTLNDIQLKKEIVFGKLTSTAEEMAFGQVPAARSEYLQDYVRGLGEQFDRYVRQADSQMQKIEGMEAAPEDLKEAFRQMHRQTWAYDATVQAIFQSVEKGGYQLSLDDLENTDDQQRILARNVQNIVGRVWDLVYASTDRSRHWHQQSKVMFWFSLSLTAVLGLLVFAFKQSVDQISLQKKDVEKLNKELDRFVHTVSHDIAGPLTTIVGYAAYLESHYMQQLDAQGRNCISGVRKGASRLNVLIKDMLELTRMSRVKNPYSRFSVHEALEAARANCDFKVRESGAAIEVKGRLPDIVGDRIKTTAAFSNLINNALKFAKPGVPPVITIGWNETPKEYEFYVQDNGIGIDPKHHHEIFEIFKRLHSTEKYSGSGVGLTIVKAAIEDQGGRVRVESSLGAGTRFIFTIPKSLIPAKPLY